MLYIEATGGHAIKSIHAISSTTMSNLNCSVHEKENQSASKENVERNQLLHYQKIITQKKKYLAGNSPASQIR